MSQGTKCFWRDWVTITILILFKPLGTNEISDYPSHTWTIFHLNLKIKHKGWEPGMKRWGTLLWTVHQTTVKTLPTQNKTLPPSEQLPRMFQVDGNSSWATAIIKSLSRDCRSFILSPNLSSNILWLAAVTHSAWSTRKRDNLQDRFSL